MDNSRFGLLRLRIVTMVVMIILVLFVGTCSMLTGEFGPGL